MQYIAIGNRHAQMGAACLQLCTVHIEYWEVPNLASKYTLCKLLKKHLSAYCAKWCPLHMSMLPCSSTAAIQVPKGTLHKESSLKCDDYSIHGAWHLEAKPKLWEGCCSILTNADHLQLFEVHQMLGTQVHSTPTGTQQLQPGTCYFMHSSRFI